MLVDIVKQIVARYGAQVLSNPKRVEACLGDMAKDEPKPLKRAFVDCLKHKTLKTLKEVAEEEWDDCKEKIAQRLCTEEGCEVDWYRQSIDILSEVLPDCVQNSDEFDEVLEKSTVVLKINRHDGMLFEDPRDKNVYKTVKIGNQVWMAENLNYKTNHTGYSWYYDANEAAYGDKYGMLYTWEEALIACPKGWHLPTLKEWHKLLKVVGGLSVAGNKLKAASDWESGNGTDDYGFSALPGGLRSSDKKRYAASSKSGKFNRILEFDHVRRFGYWWTANATRDEEALCLKMSYNNSAVAEESSHQGFGYSVRCVEGDG
jgi:uncharacterized protein (TIGR02145 family)